MSTRLSSGLPRLMAFDLPGHIGADHLRVAVGRAMRRDGDLRMGPQGTVRRQGFRREDIQRRGVELAAVEGGKNVLRHLLAAAAGIDHDGRAERSLARELADRLAVDDAVGLGRRRKQRDENVGAAAGRRRTPPRLQSNRRRECACALRLQPATRKPRSRSLFGRVLAHDAQAHDADARSVAAWVGKESQIFRRWFSSRRRCWRWCISTCSTMYSVMRPVRSGSLTRTIGMSARQGRVLQDRVDACSQRHDHLEIGQALHHAGRRQPGGAIVDVLDICPSGPARLRTSRPGATLCMAAVQTSTGQVGRMKRNAIY